MTREKKNGVGQSDSSGVGDAGLNSGDSLKTELKQDWLTEETGK